MSGNHTSRGHKGVFMDICDQLQGKYPKDFKFTGWHPNCRCYTTSILKTAEEMERDEARIMQGKEPVSGSEEQVTDVPDGFKQWVSDNDDRIRKARRLPYFLRSNGVRNRDGEYVLKEFDQYKREKTPLDIAKERHEARTSQSVADIQARADARQAVLKDYALTEKRAGNILNMASGWHEVSFVALQTAMDTVANSVVYRKAQMDELKNALKGAIADIKAQQTAEKALADIIPDVHKWHEQFTLAELQEVKNSIPKFKAEKATKYYVNNFEDLSLAKQKQLFEDEIKYVSDPDYHKPHTIKKTWEVAQSIYKKELAIVDEKIAWEATDIKLANIKVYSAANPKSLKIANLIAEAEKIKASGGSIADVEAKILEAEKIKAKNEASVASHAKIAAQKKAKELADLQQKKVGLEQQKKDLESMIALAKPTNAPGLTKMKDELKAVEKELKAVDKKIDKLGGGDPFTSDVYSQARKDAALWTKTKDAYGRYDRTPGDDYFRPFAEKDWARWSQNEKEVAFNYTSGSSYINEPLYTTYYSKKYGIHGEVRNSWDDINTLTEMIDNSVPFTRDVWLNRGVSSPGEFLGQFGVNLDPANPRSVVGLIGEQKAFMSTAHSKNWGFIDDGKAPKAPIVYNIYCPKGTKGIYAEPYSCYGYMGNSGYKWDGVTKNPVEKEVEVILQRGTKLRVTKAEYKGGKWFIDMEVIEQPPKMPNVP